MWPLYEKLSPRPSNRMLLGKFWYSMEVPDDRLGRCAVETPDKMFVSPESISKPTSSVAPFWSAMLGVRGRLSSAWRPSIGSL